VFEACQRLKHPPRAVDIAAFQTVASTLASLALTVGQRQMEESRVTNCVVGGGFGSEAVESDFEEELDLSSYGIQPNAARIATATGPIGKKSAKVVVPRTITTTQMMHHDTS
jgi:hypothetical protein